MVLGLLIPEMRLPRGPVVVPPHGGSSEGLGRDGWGGLSWAKDKGTKLPELGSWADPVPMQPDVFSKVIYRP